MTENERVRKTQRLIGAIEALRLLLKQVDVQAGELDSALQEDLKSGAVHDPGTSS